MNNLERMRKSSFGGSGRPSMSGVPLRIRNSNVNTNNGAGPSKRSSTGKSTFGAHGRSSTVAQGRPSIGAHNRISFVPKSGRSSSIGGIRGRTDPAKDPRPLSDKKYQAQCIRQLLEYLMTNSYPHAISHKLLASPTRKDFFKIFEFIYGKMCPGYKAVAKMEEEVPRVLKILGYPFTLAKSQLFSVGSPLAWPSVCASLCWMIEISEFADGVQSNDIEHLIFESTMEGKDFDGISEDKIVFDYHEATYEAFMSGEDDFSEQDCELERILKRVHLGGNLESLQEEFKQMESQLDHVEAQQDLIMKQKKKTAEYQQDVANVQEYINQLEQYSDSQLSECKAMNEECHMLELQLESEKSSVAEMQAIFQHQDLSPSDVEHLKAEQSGLRVQGEQLERQIETIDNDNWRVSMDMSAINEKVQQEVATYNRLAISLKLVPETAELAQGKDYRLTAGFSSDIVGHFERNIKPMVKTLKSHYQDNVRRKNKEKFQLQVEMEQFQESVAECEERVAQIKKQLSNLEAEIDSMKQMSLTDKKSQKEELENMQRTVAQSETLTHDQLQEKATAKSDLEEAKQLAENKREVIEKEMKEVEATRKEKTAQIAKHKEAFMHQLQSYLADLETANKIMDLRVKQAEDIYAEALKS